MKPCKWALVLTGPGGLWAIECKAPDKESGWLCGPDCPGREEVE